jgi:hypothetical protein
VTTDEVVRRLRAFEKGKPLPVGEKLRAPRLDPAQMLILAFVKMGGESAPWGVAFGRPGKTPKVLTVGEPRTRDAVADMMLEFAPSLLTHVHHPQFSSFGPDPEARLPPFQIWLPNDTHLEMLHHLAYAYTFTRFGEPARWQRLRMLGRACGWLFREAQRPGQMTVMTASRVLTDAYTFPAETTRQGHLGFLLAWLQAKGGRDARTAAAAEAERLAVSTSLDPALERDELAPYVEMHNEARDSGDQTKLERARHRIHNVLEAELSRRFTLTEAAIDFIRSDRRHENTALAKFVDESMGEHRLQYRRMEQKVDDAEDGPAFTPSPETDRYPAAAASRFYVHEASQEYLDTLMVHDDRELQAQLVASGEAIAGTIVDVRNEGTGRKTIPVWVVESHGDLPLRLREDAEVCVVGLPSRKLRIREIEKTEDQGYRFELVVTSLIRGPRDNDGSVLEATNPKLKRKKVVLVKPSMDQIARRKSMLIWNRDVPGAWLTHAVPKVPESTLPRGVAEDLREVGADEA